MGGGTKNCYFPDAYFSGKIDSGSMETYEGRLDTAQNNMAYYGVAGYYE